jgi:hypothetical protein
MKNLIFQYHLDHPVKEYNKIYAESGKISSSRFRKYAELIGAEYEFATEPTYVTVGEYPRGEELYFEWFRLIYDEKYEEYDNILFVDHDIIPNTTMNIFDHIEGDINGVYESEWETWAPWDNFSKYADRTKDDVVELYRKMERMNYPIVNIYEPTPSIMMIVNTGVLVLTKEGRKMLRENLGDWKKYVDDSWIDKDKPSSSWLSNDQFFFSWECALHDIEVHCMNKFWNGKYTYNEENYADSYFIHFQGCRDKLIEIYNK